MAIIKRNNTYQVKVRGTDGKWLSRTFVTKLEAIRYETSVKHQISAGGELTGAINSVTMDDYFPKWFESVLRSASPGWRRCQWQFYHSYVRPVLGHVKVKSVTPVLIAKVIGFVADRGKSEQTQLHVYNLVRKMFRDAVEMFRILNYSPVLSKQKPKVPLKETKHLSLSQIRQLLAHVRDTDYGVAIWLQIYLGLRVSEVIALQWSDVDLDGGTVTIARSYSRKDSWVTGKRVFSDSPKGRKQHTQHLPLELIQFLKGAKKNTTGDYVAATPFQEILSYEFYLESLKGYCRELEIPVIGTHGLRHSTSELYLHHGASKDDLRTLFAHSSQELTDRYIHGRGNNLEKVASVIRLFPDSSQSVCSQNVPNSGIGRIRGGQKER